MYPSFITASMAGLLLSLAACTGPHQVITHQPAVVSSNAQSIRVAQQATVTPSSSSLAFNAPVINNRIIEKGGRYVFIPPAFTMTRPEKGAEKLSIETLQQKVRKIRKFAASNHYDTTVAFFIDMQVKSGRDRFMVVNLTSSSIIKKGLVAHGKGNEKFTFDRKFSNDEGSNCSSLGVYKIGRAYNGAFGLSYKLTGLNKTNNNALKRYVVLHAMGSIPCAESKWPITQTEGCPAVAPAFLDDLAPILDQTDKSILLYIYYGNTQ